MEQGKGREGLYYIMSLNVIAYVKSKGIKEVEVEVTDNDRIKYWFEDTPRLNEVIEEYKSNKAFRDFTYNLKQIKDYVHTLKGKN